MVFHAVWLTEKGYLTMDWIENFLLLSLLKMPSQLFKESTRLTRVTVGILGTRGQVRMFGL